MLNKISVGALFAAAASTLSGSTKSIAPAPEPEFCASACVAVLIWSANTCVVENVFFASSEAISVTVAILSFTFLTAVTVSSARASNAAAFSVEPASAANSVTLAATSDLISARSEAFVKSSTCSVSVAVGSLSFSALDLTTSTTEFNADSNAFSSDAPEPSAALANAFTTLIICWLAFSTARASLASTSAENGLNDRGSTPSGRPSTSATSAAVIPASSISVVVGVTTVASFGAFKVIPDSTVPEDVSIVEPSVTATIVYVLFCVVSV